MLRDRTQVLDGLETGFHGRRVLVVGDLMLDRYLWGEVARISPEAPVPVVRVTRQTHTAGGAGNVALNLAGLGISAAVAGYVGTDSNRDRLLGLLREAGVDTGAVIALPDRPTTTKTRVIGGHQQMLRLDFEEPEAVTETETLLAQVDAILSEGIAAVVLSDYAKGALSPALCRGVIVRARDAGIPVLVDPKGRDFGKYAGATALSPNRPELATVTGMPPHDLDALLDAGEKLRAELGLSFLAVTLSELGIALLTPGSHQRIPSVAREVFDVSGAGDTVIAALAAGLAGGLALDDAVQLANIAAGVVVGKVGTAPISRLELIEAVASTHPAAQSTKVYSWDALKHRVELWRSRGDRIVFTNGCFDVLHVGHVTLLETARRQGDRLVVGLNTDRSVRGLKGVTRPIIGEADRARILASLEPVDAVVLFDGETPLELIRALRPDVLVKGGDYTLSQVVGAEEVQSWGGEIVLVPPVPGCSTTQVVSRIRANRAAQ